MAPDVSLCIINDEYKYRGGSSSQISIGKGRIMAKRNRHSFQKMEKEFKRKKKAKEKLARRQGKKDKVINDVDEQEYSD